MSTFDTIGPVDPDTGRWKGVPEPDVIEEIEAAGQSAFVESTLLPIQLGIDTTQEQIEALGVVLGEPVDELFRKAVLPTGWKKVALDHHMWSIVVDETGTERLSIFFKAAPYDRRAFMELSRD
jgi:hypothetical protein